MAYYVTSHIETKLLGCYLSALLAKPISELRNDYEIQLKPQVFCDKNGKLQQNQGTDSIAFGSAHKKTRVTCTYVPKFSVIKPHSEIRKSGDTSPSVMHVLLEAVLALLFYER